MKKATSSRALATRGIESLELDRGDSSPPTHPDTSGARILAYHELGSYPTDVRISRFAVLSFVLAVLSTPALLFKLVWASVYSWLATQPWVRPSQAVHLTNISLMAPTILSLILCIVAAVRVGRNRDRLRGDTLAMLGMCLCMLWMFIGSCLLTIVL